MNVEGLPMPIGGGSYAGESPYVGGQLARVATLKERLHLAVQQAEEKLAAVKRAQEIFDKHPDLEELLNIMLRGSF